MTCLLLIFLCAVIGCMTDPECGPNELLDKCPVECASDYCPKSEEEARLSCPSTPKTCPPPACKCGVNYRWASPTNRTCVPTRECPPFKCKGLNEECNLCPPLCPTDSCTQATPDGRCPKLFGHILILLICSPTCRCKKNYWRQDGVCIPYSECPQNLKPNNATDVPQPAIMAPNVPGASPQDDGPYDEYTLPQESAASSYATATATASSDCSSPSANAASNAGSSEECGSSENQCSGQNEEYVLEKQSCPGEECFVITARINCTDAPPPQPGCACKSGYYRLKETSPCIHMCECPQMANALECKDYSAEPEICDD